MPGAPSSFIAPRLPGLQLDFEMEGGVWLSYKVTPVRVTGARVGRRASNMS